MNKTQLIGRLVKDIDMRVGEKSVARFTLAVDRRGKDKGADFINCVAFNKTAETLNRYVSKGHRLGIVGHIHTDSYEKEGRKIYTTNVVVDDFDFLEPKKSDQAYDGFPL